MRIALVASSLRLGGAEKQFVYFARALLDAGMEPRVFYLGAGGHYQRVLTEAGIPLQQVFKPNHPVTMLAQLSRELRRFNPDIVLASQFGDLAFAAPAGRCCRALVVGGIRSDGFYELRSCGRRSRLLLWLTHGLIANSLRAQQNLASQGVAGYKIRVLPNVIDLQDFDQRAAIPLNFSLPSDRLLVTCVGSLHPCKRFDRFLEALALVRKQQPDVFGILVGKDLGAKPALETKASDLGLLPAGVQFQGESAHVAAWLSRSHAFVLCSEYEGFPNVILEAMSARLPVITTPAGDAARIVQDRLTGYVVEADNAPAMADCIVRLMRDPALRARFGQAGRQRVEQEYNFSKLAPRLVTALEQIAGQHGKTSITEKLARQASFGIAREKTIAATSAPKTLAAAP
jgi:glycosyltransferase involved in cell wall biosynthesis